jgi:hypothetical protein
MAKTRFRGFSVKKLGFQGLNCKNRDLKHNYTYKPKVYSVKDQRGTSGGKTRKLRGLNEENMTWL